MAKTVIVRAICDRCKAEGNEGVDSAEEVAFSYDGYSYGLDLCTPHAGEFHETIQSMIGASADRSALSAARRPRSSRANEPMGDGVVRQPARRDREQTGAIRDWANSHGYKVSSRGRIPTEVEAAYNTAH